MPERNVELLQQVMQHIKDRPEQHWQNIWVNECGTEACFCGWAALLSGHEVDELGTHNAGCMQDLGADLLGLEHKEADLLFRASNSREMLELMVKDLVNGDQLRDQLDYYIEAGE